MNIPALAALRDRARHWLDRHRHTRDEQPHQPAGDAPPAIISASLGYHPPHR
ncbi:hypothetical protein HLB23_21415 [Nocardia uniformis]|uniref:Uncharacterized protein n=1 Tax=Nocardia uniformis TaxID=53432 RepID=A0A849C915_9NOCA|nr:hypothetical protein [Nocardia uniformis]NNH72387.1 hypothetical protein [Nocardia uniformis]